MKKVLITLCIACMAISAYAVEIPEQGFGVQIGWAQPILRLNDPSSLYPKDSLVNTTKLNGFKVGVVYDASYIAGFGSSMGINYTFAAGGTDWRKKSNLQPAVFPKIRDKMMYHEIEVFVDWQYKFELAKETSLHSLDKINEEDKNIVCNLCGTGMILMAVGMIATAVIFGITEHILSLIPFGVCFIIGLTIMLVTTLKYNK